ncbi:MAG: hypothetical protein U5K56_00160 [Halioglobus sp.]|nr:hypothetical protein [Halioglobus sp.]
MLAWLSARCRAGTALRISCPRPLDPARGLRCNPAKLLLDPYARAVDGQVTWDEAVFPYRFDDPEDSFNDADSAPFVPRSVLIDPAFDWDDDRHPRTPWHETVIYETHVKGFSVRHPDIPEELRGTYAGLGHPAGAGVPHGAGCHRRGTHARSPVHPLRPSAGEGPAQLLGLQQYRLLRPAQRLRL